MTCVDEPIVRPTSPSVRSKRRRILLSAYAVSPVRGSEPGVGWNLCTRLARFHDVTVLCSPFVPPRQEMFREEIENHLHRHGPIPGLEFVYVDPPPLSYYCQRESLLIRRTLYYTGYRAWQKTAYRIAAKLHQSRPFDLVHHLNITGYREPGYLWKLPIPFVWGPVGGAADVPSPFLSMMGPAERLFYRVRNAVNTVQRCAARRCREAARRARHIWVIGDAERRLVESWGCIAEGMIETGTSPQPLARRRVHEFSRPLRLAWSGQHIGRKALPLLLHALTNLPNNSVELVILGDGPESKRWRTLADRLALSSRLRWTGRLPHAAAIDELAAADALAFTGVQEGTPHVVLEALSLGLPVICHDACGMGQAVTIDCGLKIPLQDPDTSIAGFRSAIERLCFDQELLERLSAGALARASQLSWDAKAAAIAAVYERVCELAAAGRECAS